MKVNLALHIYARAAKANAAGVPNGGNGSIWSHIS